MWTIAERNSAVEKTVDEYYKKLSSMFYEVLKQDAPENYQSQQLDNAVAILLLFIEGYCVTFSNLKVSTKTLVEQLVFILYKLLSESKRFNTDAT